MAVVSNQKLSGVEKEKAIISKLAFIILMAFCLQFVFYIFCINVIPFAADINKNGKIESPDEIMGFYKEKWYSYKGSTGEIKVDNGMQFIHGYNMFLLAATAGISIYYLIILLDEKNIMWKAKEFFKKNLGLLLLLLFMTWVFISSLLAYDKFRSFIGCYNLRDGYLSFMFYGSVLVCMLLLGRKNEKYKRIVTDTFIAVTMLIALLTMMNYFAIINEGSFLSNWRYYGLADAISIENGANTAEFIKDGWMLDVKIYGANKVSILAGPFNNSNHYGYLLSISVVVAAVMLIKEKKYIWARLAYAFALAIMTYMLILNNTFGAYLGVGTALGLMFIYALVTGIINKDFENILDELVGTIFALAIFVVASFNVQNYSGQNIAKTNFDDITNSVESIVNSIMPEKEVNDSENSSDENNDKETNESQVSTSATSSSAAEAGSGRWKLWVGALEIVKKFPLFGCGLENMLYEYAEIGINEGRSHNLLLQLAGTTGIPGALLYFSGIIAIFWVGLMKIKYWDTYAYMGMFVIISYMISSMTGNSGFYTSGYFYIFVGLLVLSIWNIREKQEEIALAKIKAEREQKKANKKTNDNLNNNSNDSSSNDSNKKSNKNKNK